MTPYVAPPLPERELPACEVVVSKLRETGSCFGFRRDGFAFTAFELAGSGCHVLRIDRCDAPAALVAFSQYLYEHPERRRAALIVIGGMAPTRENLNRFIELFPDFPLLLPAEVPEELRFYAVARAELKGVTLLVAR